MCGSKHEGVKHYTWENDRKYTKCDTSVKKQIKSFEVVFCCCDCF